MRGHHELFIICVAANLNESGLGIAQNERTKGSNWSSSADEICLPAFQKSNPKNLRAAF